MSNWWQRFSLEDSLLLALSRSRWSLMVAEDLANDVDFALEQGDDVQILLPAEFPAARTLLDSLQEVQADGPSDQAKQRLGGRIGALYRMMVEEDERRGICALNPRPIFPVTIDGKVVHGLDELDEVADRPGAEGFDSVNRPVVVVSVGADLAVVLQGFVSPDYESS
jgi:hypothetical protein